MHRDARIANPRVDRNRRRFRPSLSGLEERIVPSLYFQGATGITFDSSGDVFVSYDSSGFSGQQQSVAEVSSNGFLVSSSVFSTSGGSAFPGTLTTIGASANLPSPSGAGDILELQPNGQLFIFNPVSGSSAAVRQPVQLHGQCVQRLRRPDGRVRRSEQPDQSGRGDLRRFWDFRSFARGVRRVEQLGLRDAADLRVVGRGRDRAGRFPGQRRALGRTRGGRRRLAGHGPHDPALCAGGNLDGHSRARRVQHQLRFGKHARAGPADARV